MLDLLKAESEKIAHGYEEAIYKAKKPMDYFIYMNSNIFKPRNMVALLGRIVR